MTLTELRALAILVNGTVINNEVYVAAPEDPNAPEDQMCLGCAFAQDSKVPSVSHWTRKYCDLFRSCHGVIRVKVTT